jgi:hypothetical protein
MTVACQALTNLHDEDPRVASMKIHDSREDVFTEQFPCEVVDNTSKTP